jgi:aspartyl-tRNA synthetase
MNRWRDLYCGELRVDDVGRTIAVAGWVARRRDHGGLIFIDLRDHTGIVQLVVNPERSPDAAKEAHAIRSEFVVRAAGEVVARAAGAVNPNIATGAVEIQVDELELVARSEPLPFQLDDDNVEEPLRLRYRYLDLRRERMQRNLRLSHTIVAAIRDSMEEQGFIDIWTPTMTLGTPEGARDFLVPVRLQPGTFFALAQSPQLFKQTLMIGGLDRYYQIATCWRDEDLRADRQFEFRQLDLELAFPTREDVMDVLERVVVASFEAVGRTPPARPFNRLSYADAMLRYGTDKPDTRFALEIQDATEITRGSEFGVFKGAERVRFLVAPKAFSRAELQRLEEFAKEWGAKGLAYLVVDDSGEVRSPIAKFLSADELAAFAVPPGSTVLFAADTQPMVERVLGARRAARLDRSVSRRAALGGRLPALPPRRGDRAVDVRPPSLHEPRRRSRGSDRQRSRRHAEPALRPDLERLGARLGLDQDPSPGDPGARLPRDGDERRRGAHEVRLVPRSPADGRAAARWVRPRHRALRCALRR